MIKVLQVITDTNIGGAGTYLLTLLDFYDKSRFEMEAALPIGSRLLPLLRQRGVFCTEVPYIADRSFSLKAVRALTSVLKARKPDVIHTHAALSARVAARLAGPCKIVYIRHTVVTPAPYATRFPFRQGAWLVNQCLSDAIIAVSPAAQQNLEQTGAPAKKIEVIYNGAPPVRRLSPTEKKEARKKLGVPEGVFVVSHMARLVTGKGHDYVLDAAKKTCPKDVLFLLAGDGPLKGHLQKRLEEENIQNVRLLGFVEEVPALLGITAVQVNASVSMEATSIALLEGMSLGIPAVVSDWGGNPYVIRHGENGLVFRQKDAEELFTALQRLINEPALYSRLSEGAAKIYQERFTAANSVAQTEALYEKIVRKGAL